MVFVVLATGASAGARSIVHSHQDSFGHELGLFSRRGHDPATIPVACTCGWSGVLAAADVVLDCRVAA